MPQLPMNATPQVQFLIEERVRQGRNEVTGLACVHTTGQPVYGETVGQVFLSVGTSGTEVVLNSTTVTANGTTTVSSLTYTAPA